VKTSSHPPVLLIGVAVQSVKNLRLNAVQIKENGAGIEMGIAPI
jgi:hypothetical protein